MKIRIVRSFSQTKQLKQYEPVNAFCSVEMEFKVSNGKTNEEACSICVGPSLELDSFCRAEVKKTLDNLIEPSQEKHKLESPEKTANDLFASVESENNNPAKENRAEKIKRYSVEDNNLKTKGPWDKKLERQEDAKASAELSAGDMVEE